MKPFALSLLLLCFAITNAFAQETLFRQPSSYVLAFIGNDSIAFSSINHNAFRIYFKDSSYTATHLETIKQDLDLAYTRILSVLNIPAYKYGIYLIAVNSREEMQQLMGYKIKGGAAQGHDLVFFVYNETTRPQFKHEIFHLLSFEVWGQTKYRLLDEGGATYADNFCFYDNPIYAINAYFLEQKKLFSLNSLISNFDNKAKENEVIAYLQSAGIFKYLYEKYGPEKMQLLWVNGFEDFKNIYGFSTQQLETEWLNFIKTIPIPQNLDEAKLMSNGCG